MLTRRIPPAYLTHNGDAENINLDSKFLIDIITTIHTSQGASILNKDNHSIDVKVSGGTTQTQILLL